MQCCKTTTRSQHAIKQHCAGVVVVLTLSTTRYVHPSQDTYQQYVIEHHWIIKNIILEVLFNQYLRKSDFVSFLTFKYISVVKDLCFIFRHTGFKFWPRDWKCRHVYYGFPQSFHTFCNITLNQAVMVPSISFPVY